MGAGRDQVSKTKAAGLTRWLSRKGLRLRQSVRLPQVIPTAAICPNIHDAYKINKQMKKKTKKKAHKEATEEDILTPTSLPCMPA